MSDANTSVYKLSELCEMTGFTQRQVADLRKKGALPPPNGRSKGARYSDKHIDALRAIRELSGAGISRKRIASYLGTQQRPLQPVLPVSGGVVTARWTRVTIDQQIEIGVMAGGSSDVRNRALLDHLVDEAQRFIGQSSKAR